jgi:hypothetical protein
MSIPKFDVCGFAVSLKRDSLGAIHEALIRHFISKALGVLYGYYNYPSWLSLFRGLIRRRRFLLIVLDDARYDVFMSMHSRYLHGALSIARVPPPNTYGWLPRAFSMPEFNRVRVFYASIGIESHDIRIGSFVPRDRDVEVIPIRPNRAKHLLTVLPSEVNEVVRRVGLSGRDIVWYAQPHFPWIADEELSPMLMRDALIHDYIPPDTIRRRLRERNIPKDRVIKAYYANLILVLRHVRELLNYVEDQGIKYDEIVITSDHGEMLGELGLYLHQEYDLPQLVLVPWLKVT